jgi:beta-lactamase class A
MRRTGPDYLRWISLFLLLSAVVLFFVELVSYSRQRSKLPFGMTIAGVPVGGVSPVTASERLLEVYGTPLELHYDDQVILMQPAAVGFRLDTEGMLAAAETVRTETGFWGGFWDFLWNRVGESVTVPLRAEYSTTQLDAVLQDLAARYDQPGTPVQPIPGTTSFSPGTPGRVLDRERAAELIAVSLQSPTDRRLDLPIVASTPGKAGFSVLQTLLEQNIDVAGFNGLADLYIVDLRTGEELHFARNAGERISLEPDVAFTAGSTIKIPIMVAYYRYFDEPLDDEADRWMREMITLSGNDPADWLMERIDPVRGPLQVTETMEELGYENTFLAGYFSPGAPLLRTYTTPANQRLDVRTDPDVYNQTTPSDMGMLLVDIYECSQGGGTLRAVFPDQITQAECQKMLDLLSQNKIGVLIEAGVPDGTRVAHKHGWTESPLRWVEDVGIVYSPRGDYVLVAFLYDTNEMIWDGISRLVAQISQATFNYFNPPS